METGEIIAGVLNDVKDGLITDIEFVADQLESHLQDVVVRFQELDGVFSTWLSDTLHHTPASLMLATAVFLLLLMITMSWSHWKISRTNIQLEDMESDKAFETELVTLYKSKAILRHLIQEIETFQLGARKQAIKDAMAMAMLSDRIEVLNEILTEMCLFRPFPCSGHVCFNDPRTNAGRIGNLDQRELLPYRGQPEKTHLA